jgi:hypothetical protein
MSDKASLFKDYLNQQADNIFIDGLLNPDSLQLHKNPILQQRQITSSEQDDLERFKTIVKYYMKTDNEIKEIKSKIKLLNSEKKKRQELIESITPSIMEYMTENDIEELNSKEGKIEYKKSFVKSPLTNSMIKKQLYDRFGEAEELKTFLDQIFSDREKIEKQSLRRINH